MSSSSSPGGTRKEQDDPGERVLSAAKAFLQFLETIDRAAEKPETETEDYGS